MCHVLPPTRYHTRRIPWRSLFLPLLSFSHNECHVTLAFDLTRVTVRVSASAHVPVFHVTVTGEANRPITGISPHIADCGRLYHMLSQLGYDPSYSTTFGAQGLFWVS